MNWLPQEAIRRKRDGQALGAPELARIAASIADGSLSDAQVGAFAMAVQLRGMTAEECNSGTGPKVAYAWIIPAVRLVCHTVCVG